MVWTFGVDPLSQTIEAAALLRRVTGLLLALEGEEPEVDRILMELRRAEAVLADRVPLGTEPRVGGAASGSGRVYLDHGRQVGDFNPCFPMYEIEVDGSRANGWVTFPIPYEGPPGIVHGGFLGVFFDCVVQHHNCEIGVAGKTTALRLRYRRPAPLLTPLSFVLERVVTDGRIRSTATLSDGEVVLCEAEVDAVEGDHAALPEVAPRRAEGQ
jgi:hypothetical protein